MQALRVHGPGDVRLDTLPDPEPGPRDAVIRVVASGLCGSDLAYARQGGLGGPGPEPLALGHEFAGVVIAIGDQVTRHGIGDRVVVYPGNERLGRIGGGGPQGGLADLVLVEEADLRLLGVPDRLPLATAALVEPVAVALHAVHQLAPRPGERAVVMGAGPIGLAAVAGLLDAGVSSVVVVDPVAERRAIALDLGAEAALDPTRPGLWKQISGVHGNHDQGRAPASELYVEATGVGQVFTDLVNRCGARSRIVVPGLHLVDTTISLLSVMTKELTIVGSMEYPEPFSLALDLVLRRDLSPLSTASTTLAEAATLLTDPARLRAAGKTLVLMEET